MEHKTFPAELKADDQGIVTAYVSAFRETPDHQGDRVIRGAFQKSLVKRPTIPMLWMHSESQPIGKWTSAVEDDTGLRLTGKVALKTSMGRDAFELMKEGVISTFSIGYLPVLADYDENCTRLLKELDLFEASPVVFAADDQATLVGVKSDQPDALDLALKEVADYVIEFKAGARNSAADQSRIQVVHDMASQVHAHTAALGADHTPDCGYGAFDAALDEAVPKADVPTLNTKADDDLSDEDIAAIVVSTLHAIEA